MNKKDNLWIGIMNYGERIGCHQMPERSFFLKGYQFPVCARCTGVIVGEIIAIIFWICNVKISLISSIALLLIMGFDWFIQYINLLQSNNIRRLITGILGGIGLTSMYYNLLMYIIELVKNFIK